MNKNKESSTPYETVDFSDAIATAISVASSLDASNPLSNNLVDDDYIDCPDDYILLASQKGGDESIVVVDPVQYHELLLQSARALSGSNTLSQDYLLKIQDVVRHESAHHQAALRFGNNETESFLGIRFMKDENGLVMWPVHFITGPMKKIHVAAIALTPFDRSATDIEIARILGYRNEDIKSLLSAAEKEPPVEDNITGQILKRRLVERLMAQ